MLGQKYIACVSNCFFAQIKTMAREASCKVLNDETAKWHKPIGFCTCKIGYVFGKSGLLPGTAIYAADESMVILMFVEASNWALKLHSKLVSENNEI